MKGAVSQGCGLFILAIFYIVHFAAANFIAANCTLKAQKPKDNVCLKRGHIPHRYYTPAYEGYDTDSSVATLNDCKDRCANSFSPPKPMGVYNFDFQHGCITFGYNTDTGECVLSQTQLQNPDPEYGLQFSPDPKSPVIWSSIHCYDCSVNCPTPDNANILIDSNFESSGNSLGPWYTDFGILSSPGRNSKHSFLAQPDKDFGDRLIQGVIFCLQQFYELSFDVKPMPHTPSKRNETPYCYVSAIVGQDFSLSRNFSKNEFGKWQTINTTFHPSRGDYTDRDYPGGNQSLNQELELYFKARACNIFIDNVRLTPAPKSFKTVGPSLVNNGGFESGKLAPWKLSYTDKAVHNPADFGVVKPGLTSNSTFAFSFSDPTSFDTAGSYYYYPNRGGFNLKQKLKTLQANELYVLSFNYRAGNTNDIQVDILADNQMSTHSWTQYKDEPGLRNNPTVYKRTPGVSIDNSTMSFQVLFAVPLTTKPIIDFTFKYIEDGKKEVVTQTAMLDNIEVRKLASG